MFNLSILFLVKNNKLKFLYILVVVFFKLNVVYVFRFGINVLYGNKS